MEATQQRKRLRSSNAASSSDHSKNSDDEIQQLNVLENISDAETEDDISGGGKAPSAPPVHAVSVKTKCWLFFDVPPKGIKHIITNCFVCAF